MCAYLCPVLYSMCAYLCPVLYSMYSMCAYLCPVLYSMYSMYAYLCPVLYSMYSMYAYLCPVLYSMYSMYAYLCPVLYSMYSMCAYLCPVLYSMYSMCAYLCPVLYSMYSMCIISHRDKANANNDARRQQRRAASGRTRTRDVLHSRQTLYQLSHRGSSAGQAESLEFIQGKWRLSPDKQGYPCYMYLCPVLQRALSSEHFACFDLNWHSMY